MRRVKYEVYEGGSFEKPNHHFNTSLIGVPFEGRASSSAPFVKTVSNFKQYLHANTQRTQNLSSSTCSHVFLSKAERDFWIGFFDTEDLLTRTRYFYELCENEARNSDHFFLNHSSTVEYSNLDDLETVLKQLLDLSTVAGLAKGSAPGIISDTLGILSLSELTNSVDELFSILQDGLKEKRTGFTTELISRNYPISLLLDKFEEIIDSLEAQINSFCATAASLSNVFDDIEKVYLPF